MGGFLRRRSYPYELVERLREYVKDHPHSSYKDIQLKAMDIFGFVVPQSTISTWLLKYNMTRQSTRRRRRNYWKEDDATSNDEASDKPQPEETADNKNQLQSTTTAIENGNDQSSSLNRKSSSPSIIQDSPANASPPLEVTATGTKKTRHDASDTQYEDSPEFFARLFTLQPNVCRKRSSEKPQLEAYLLKMIYMILKRYCEQASKSTTSDTNLPVYSTSSNRTELNQNSKADGFEPINGTHTDSTERQKAAREILALNIQKKQDQQAKIPITINEIISKAREDNMASQTDTARIWRVLNKYWLSYKIRELDTGIITFDKYIEYVAQKFPELKPKYLANSDSQNQQQPLPQQNGSTATKEHYSQTSFLSSSENAVRRASFGLDQSTKMAAARQQKSAAIAVASTTRSMDSKQTPSQFSLPIDSSIQPTINKISNGITEKSSFSQFDKESSEIADILISLPRRFDQTQRKHSHSETSSTNNSFTTNNYNFQSNDTFYEDDKFNRNNDIENNNNKPAKRNHHDSFSSFDKTDSIASHKKARTLLTPKQEPADNPAAKKKTDSNYMEKPLPPLLKETKERDDENFEETQPDDLDGSTLYLHSSSAAPSKEANTPLNSQKNDAIENNHAVNFKFCQLFKTECKGKKTSLEDIEKLYNEIFQNFQADNNSNNTNNTSKLDAKSKSETSVKRFSISQIVGILEKADLLN